MFNLDELLGKPWWHLFTIETGSGNGSGGGDDNRDANDDDDDDDDDDDEDDIDDKDDKNDQKGDSDKNREARYRERAKDYKRKLKEAEQEIAKLKSGKDDDNDGLRLLRAENAFIKAAVAKGIDPDAAWKLADQPAIVASWDDNNQTFTAIGDSLEQVVERYPYVAGNEDKEDRVTFPPPASTSGKPTNKRRQAGHKLDRAYLEAKYPALRGRTRA